MSRRQDITNVQKSCDKMSTFPWKASWTWQTCLKNSVTKRLQFAEQAAGHHKCPEKGVTKCPNFAEKPAEHGKRVGKNPLTKRPQFAKQAVGHHKCQEICRCDKMSTFCWKAGWTCKHVEKSCDKMSAVCWAGGRTSQMFKNHATKRPHFTEKRAGHRKRVGKNPVTTHPIVAKQLAWRH